jgi:formate dehydrogenase subunit gamma
LERLLGGHVAAARGHRWAGYLLLAAFGLLAVTRAGSIARFITGSVRFRRSDLRWFATYPAFLLRRREAPARHEGHFDPGQRLLNVAVVVSFLALGATGVVMGFPDAVSPAAFAWSLRVHRAATWILVVAVAGHLLVASGILPAYRGVWRAMHLDGTVWLSVARRLWPRWTEDGRQQDRR